MIRNAQYYATVVAVVDDHYRSHASLGPPNMARAHDDDDDAIRCDGWMTLVKVIVSLATAATGSNL